MNEFTKEELGIIACNLCVNPKTVNILIKLESMIDNYCEHNAEGGEVEIFVDTCSKCSAYILREKHYDN